MQDLNRIPRKQEGYSLQEVDGENVLFGRTRATAYYLNESASVIWSMCDGTRTVGEIVEFLAETYPENAADVRADVLQVVEGLVAQGVLALQDKPPDRSPSSV
jgi:hypothetical protein